MQNPKVIRTFVAVLIDEDLRKRISEVQERVKKLTPNVKWVEPDSFHVTLKFLGNISEDRIPQICAAVGNAVQSIPAFDLSIEKIGVFPHPRRPRVVWVGIEEGREQLIKLASTVESALVDIGFEKEDKPFKAHITIGRVKESKPVGDLVEGLDDTDANDLGRQRVASVSVMQSELMPAGPRYSALSVHKLA